MAPYPASLTRLIDALVRLPGIGPKSAQRLAFYLLKAAREETVGLAEAIVELKERIRTCPVCFNITEEAACAICQDPSRDREVVCVVEEPNDLLAIEKTRGFRGVYHVLEGSLSPLEGRGPDQIRGKALLDRVEGGRVREVILATNPNVEGEATALYLTRLLRNSGVRVTRIARGLPIGGDLEYADEVTLTRALEGRRDVT